MKNLFCILLISAAFILNSFTYRDLNLDKCTVVTYKVVKPDYESTNSQPNSSASKLITDIKSAFNEIECKLYYTAEKSVFMQVDKLQKSDNDMAYKMASVHVAGIYYKDLSSKEKIKHLEMFGEISNIVSPFEEYNWEITGETKIINGYKCYKATCVYEEVDLTRERVNRFTPEVWFTPQIPASFGPRGLDGLPGLVLEGKFNNWANFYAVKIEFDVADTTVDFSRPSKGKFYSKEAFQKFMADVMTKLKEE